MGRFRKIAVLTAVLALLMQLVGTTVASSQKVGNPSGPFTYTIHNAHLRIKESPFDFDDQRVPQCSNGVNDDEDFLGDASQHQDTAIDYPADPQCTSPTDDSEVQGGFQAVAPVTVTGSIAANGAWVVNAPTQVNFPPAYAYAKNPVGSAFIVTVQIKGLGTWTGSLNPLTGDASLPMQLQVSIVGTNTISSTCHIGDPSGADTLIAQASSTKPGGSGYNSSTGSLTMSDQGFRVPEAKDCGSILGVSIADQISSSFGIPTTDTDATFTGDFPAGGRPTRAITPAVAATPGVACRATTLSAAGSTALRPIASYGFDDTNDGVIDVTSASPSRSVTYATSGSKTARVRVTDDQGDFSDATTTFTVGPNLPPTAPNVSLPRSGAGQPVNFTLGGSDPEGGAVTRTVIVPPVNGSLTGTAPNLTYTPNPGFTGTDVLTYSVSDDCAQSADSTGTVQFNVNRNPVADNQTVTTNQDIPVNLTLTGSDPDGDPLTYSLASTPAHGSLTGTAPNLQYIPDPGFFGLDSFQFNVNDGLNGSTTPGTITLNVVKNTRPVADPQIATTPEDTGTDITLTGSDADGDTLAYTVLTSTTHGALAGTAPNLHYEPNANYNGPDSFTFQVNDGKGGTNTATVTINVTPVNDAPVANDQSFNLQHDTSKPVPLDVHDDDGDALSYTPLTPVAHGVLTGSFPNFTYVPSAGYIGPDTLVYQVSDGTDTDTATVTFNVTATNQPPVAPSATVNTNEDTAKAINLNTSDPEGDAITTVITQDPAHGSLTGTAPNLTYTPDADYFGPDSFTYSVTDTLDQTSIGTISINVLAVNDVPVATPQTVGATEDTPQTIILGATDADDAVLTYQVVSTPAHGTVTGTAPNVTYTPAANFHGTDSFTFRARDPKGATGTATITVVVGSVNDAPKATNLSKTVVEDGTLALTVAATDVDGDALTYAVVGGPAHGTVTGSGPAFTYKPAPNYNGFDTFTFAANDGTTTGNAATVTISVTAVNDAPVAGTQPLLTVAEDTPRTITLTGSDVDGDALTYKVTVAPKHGKLTGTAPNLTYTPTADYNGPDSFTFTVTDPKGLKGTAVIDLTVVGAPLIPTQVVADPIIAKVNILTLKVTYPKLTAHLTRVDSGAPIASKSIEFYVNGAKVCTAVTNAQGVASCNGSSNTFRNTYIAQFNGDADLAASSGNGGVFK